jgi:tRNA pseudouridine13 synthase
VARFPGWADGLARFDLRQERRALRLSVQGLVWSRREIGIQLAFALAAGSYATAVLRELALCLPNGDEAD